MERRKHPRIPQRLCLTIDELPGRNIAFTGDISQEGISIETQAPLAMGSTVTIKLTLPTGKSLAVIGHVRWVARNSLSKGGMNRYGIGISLKHVPEEFRHFITALSAAQQAQMTPAPVDPSSSTDEPIHDGAVQGEPVHDEPAHEKPVVAVAPPVQGEPGDEEPVQGTPVERASLQADRQTEHGLSTVSSAEQPQAGPYPEPRREALVDEVAPMETASESMGGSDSELPDPQPIMAAYEALKQQNHYEVLGLEPQATPAQIKQTYYTLSKTYHPQGPMGECSRELQHNLEELFHRIAEAYVTLSSVEQRETYNRSLAKQQTGPSNTPSTKQHSVARHVQQGVLELKAGNLEAAATSFELAIQARPEKWKYHTLLAYALSRLPDRQRDAEAHYRKAIELEPSRAENYIGLGRLYQRTGQVTEALRSFEDALQWDAENTRIIKEIDAIKKG